MPRLNDDQDGLRRCRDCGEWKPLDDFHTNPRRPSGRGSYCQPCFNKRSKASYARRVEAKHGRTVTPPRVLPPGLRYCPDCDAAKPLDEFPRNRADRTGYASYCKPCHNKRGREAKQRLYGGTRAYHLRRRYGIGEEEFQELLAAQGGVCGVCGDKDPRHVDHDHVTGYVRGVLCFNCNGGLGHFRDDITRMTRATRYLLATASWAPEAPGVLRVLSPDRGMYPVRRPRQRRGRGPADRISIRAD